MKGDSSCHVSNEKYRIGYERIFRRETMGERYGDGSDHMCCNDCGLCEDCGDCANYGCGSVVTEK